MYRSLARSVLAGLVVVSLGARALAQVATPSKSYKYPSRWVRMLKDADPAERRKAACILGDMDAAQAVPALTEALADKDPTVRALAASTLGRFGSQATSAAAALAGLLKDKDALVRFQAAHTLGTIGPDVRGVVVSLFEALKDPDEDVRLTAAWAIGCMGTDGKPAVPALVSLLVDPSETVRVNAAEALWRVEQNERGLQALREALREKEPFVRCLAARFINRSVAAGPLPAPASKELIAALIKGLDDSDASVRTEVALALGAFGPQAKEALPALRRTFRASRLEPWLAPAVLGRIDPTTLEGPGKKE